MKRCKKGISPLIATVLIIGFTIVLAALVITWGGDLFKGIQDETGKTADLSTKCSYLLNGVDIRNAEYDGGDLYALIDNSNPSNLNIPDVGFRIYNADGEVIVCDDETDWNLAAGEAKLVECGYTLPAGFGTITEIGATAYVTLDDGEVAKCSQEFGKVIAVDGMA